MGHLGPVQLMLLLVLWHCVRSHYLPGCHEHLTFRCSNGSCIPRHSLCDGHSDCEDGSDEQHCSQLGCMKEEYTCRSRRCISAHFLCNGVDDCGDGSDEDSCQNCTADVYFCGPSDICLPRHKLCDGRADCRDGRDETQESCASTRLRPQASPTCAASEFRCGSGQCIRQAWRCDHSLDCSDGSDEEHCDQDECRINNGGCSHECVDQPMGFLCQCPENMRLVGDSQCEDVNTCLARDVCDQLCVDVNGTFTCDCLEGYDVSPTTGECKARGEEAQLVFTSSWGMQWMSITGTEQREPAPHLSGPGLVAALASNSTLYWARRGQGSIYRVAMDGKSDDAALVLQVKGSVSGLDVDWIHRLLYWTSVESGSVNAVQLDALIQRELVTGLDEPSAVAVDPLRGFLFWAQCGGFPKIERASLDGRDTMALVTSLIHNPVALSLDMPRQLLYWVDQGTRSISRVNLEGRDRKTVAESNGYLDRPFGLAVFEGFVYWSEEVTHSVCRANKHNGSQLHVLRRNVTSPGGVVIVQPVLQPSGPSACGRPGEACRHRCVVDLLSESARFSCVFAKQDKSQESPAISRTIPASSLSDPTFAGILSSIIFLSLLLVGMAVWWWREEFRSPSYFAVQSFALKESQEPLIAQGTSADPNSSFVKESLLKLDSGWTVNEERVSQTVS